MLGLYYEFINLFYDSIYFLKASGSEFFIESKLSIAQ